MATIYLAGPIEGTSYDESINWREEVENKLKDCGIKCLSPMRDHRHLQEENSIKFKEEHGKENPTATARAITSRDRHDVLSCDAILVSLKGSQKATIGTMIEFGWADMARKPIVMIMEKEGNLHDHPMVNEIASFKVTDLEEGIIVIKSLLAH
jgi:nucleoside 2-deoxyribosyltransferase